MAPFLHPAPLLFIGMMAAFGATLIFCSISDARNR